ncbi:MAG TPA: Uma2 family endonuclease [Actinophytocola sp.]|uniref:Uma2 family endonuclease n=1 Tax=Actinophytocola sp. TaxID=1872138 RepID=UPI002DBA4F03|nr:Uma2 family endonuclease [Actinophytocola sp.]HEU5474491.1 Uma2 family endonuclease [Actinophytocola sp.]
MIVSPTPGLRHQVVLFELAIALEQACPKHLLVILGPFAVRPSSTMELQPDVLVARRADLTDQLLPVAAVLAVEVLSPSSALLDLNTKKASYERIGVPSYWVVDPQELAVVVFELDGAGRYQQVAEVKGEDVLEVERPFPVRIVPVELLDESE